jgi:outer membrane biosynthesis protein TonB
MIGWLWSKGPRRAKTEVAAASAKPAAPPPVVKVIPEVKDNDKDKEEPPPPPARRKRKEVKEEEEEDRPAPPKPPDRPKPEPAPPPAEGPTLTYEKDILPIMQRSCVSCHGGKKRGGLDLRTFPALRAGGDSGPGVQPGKPNDSPLLESVLSNRMPPGRARKLTAAEKQLIRDWIATGAKSNTR